MAIFCQFRMKAKLITFVFFLLISLFFSIYPAHAEENSSDSSAKISANFAMIIEAQKKDHRVDVLKKYLEKMHSPLAQYAQDFIVQADAYNLPWHLVAAISGTESTFGQAVPTNCNNAWGFGIYGNQVKCFDSYPEAIRVVSKSLREDYINKWRSTNVEDIGSIYASSPTWASHTLYFIQEMEAFKADYENKSLSISL